MAAPHPPKSPVEPISFPGDVKKGDKITIGALADVLQGATKAQLYTATTGAATLLDMDPVPSGRHRCIQNALFYGNGVATICQLGIVRQGVFYPLTMANANDGAATLSCAEIKGLLLEPGDILRGSDMAAAGGMDYYIYVKYADVYL